MKTLLTFEEYKFNHYAECYTSVENRCRAKYILSWRTHVKDNLLFTNTSQIVKVLEDGEEVCLRKFVIFS